MFLLLPVVSQVSCYWFVMKEIDFLPEWYKSGKRRQGGYRTQYFALSCVFVVIVVWSFVTGNSLNRAVARLDAEKTRTSVKTSGLSEFIRIKSEEADLRNKAKALVSMDSRIEISSILAEMSYLFDEKVVLKSVDFAAEKFEDKEDKKPGGGSAVRSAGRRGIRGQSLPLGAVRFKVTVEGVASNPSDYTNLVLRFEESDYFRDVSPSLHAGTKVGGSSTTESIQVSEFKIICYLANYTLKSSKSP
jgi:hypothetical protein